MAGMKVCWFSTGISSFIACYLAKDVDEIIYTHVSNQHPDSLRFLHDCEKLLGRKITVLQSDRYYSVDEVIEKKVRMKWEKEHPGHHIYVWGFDMDEYNRAERIKKSMSDYEHEFPLIDHFFSKSDCHALAKQLGLKRPKMYDLGYQNNNCIGCVKGGMGYWNKIRKDFPDIFVRRAKQEREIGHSCIKGVFLDELDPNRGRMDEEIMPDCGIGCYLISREIKEEKLKGTI